MEGNKGNEDKDKEVPAGEPPKIQFLTAKRRERPRNIKPGKVWWFV
jgi:hypothetical protein